SDTTRLSPKAIEEIRNAQNNIPNTRRLVSTEHDTSSTNIQEDEIIHIEHPGDDKDGANSHIRLNTISMKAKGESSLVKKIRITNSSKDDTFRRESDLEKLMNDTKRLAPILLYLS
ncbi:2710_t:CDS:2, partial [Dentiscutata erythropus]